MEPVSDIICALLETPFTAWNDEDKKYILQCEIPQPLLTVIQKRVERTKKVHTRNFQKWWYTGYRWLCGSHYLQKLFCWPCLLVGVKRGFWNNNGFVNLTTAIRAFQKHEGSADHIKNSIKYTEIKRKRYKIVDAVNENTRLCIIKFNDHVRLNRLFMRLPINTVLYLSKQDLPFQGHGESAPSINHENFKEMLKLLINTSSLEMQQHYASIKHIFSGDSKTTQNELINCISEYIQDFIINDITEAPFYSVQVDDFTTTFNNQTSQSSIIIRYVTLKGILVERFLGFYNVSSDDTVQTLFDLLKRILAEFSYKSKLIAQCYDGATASVMAGDLNGLQAKIKEEAPQALFIHCLSHRLNLVLKQSVARISDCRIFFASISGISSFFQHTANRTFVTDSKRILTGEDMCWLSHSKLLKVIIEEWNGLKDIFEKTIDDPMSDDESILQAKCFLNDFNDFQFTFLLFVFNDIFEKGSILSDVLEKASFDINFCVAKINTTRAIIFSKRSDTAFEDFFNLAEERVKVKLKPETLEKTLLKFKILYFEILDTILLEIDTRFQDTEKLNFISLADSAKFDEFSNKFPTHEIESLHNSYPLIMTDVQRLKNELGIIYSDYRYKNASVQNMVDILNKDGTTEVFKEAYKLFCLILTLPSTSSSDQSNIPCLKRINTYLKNTTQDRLAWPSLATISIEKQLLDDLINSMPFYEDIIDKFTALYDCKIDLIFRR